MKSIAHVWFSTGGATSGRRTRFGTRRVAAGRVLEREVRQHPFQFGVLGFELPEPLHVRHRGPAILAAPLEEGGPADAILAERRVDWNAALRVLQDPDERLGPTSVRGHPDITLVPECSGRSMARGHLRSPFPWRRVDARVRL